MLSIGIIGAGNVGGALAQQWIKAGHSVLIGIQYPASEKSRLLMDKIGHQYFTSIEKATHESEVLLIAIPPTAIAEMLAEMGDLTGKIIIDATNSLTPVSEKSPATVFQLLEEKTGAAIVKCFNSTGYENMLNPLYNGERIDMFMAGSNEQAKGTARQLALDAGFGSCIDFGKSDKVDLLEKLAASWINLAIIQGHGRHIAFKLLRR